ncbi:MAG: VOC family protein [Nitrospira sp.]|nr:VOC family protein [Nitrospira sp.]
MSDTVKAIPEGYEGATPYLVIKGATGALEFYKKAFGATEIMRIPAPGGTVGHAEIKIGKAIIMLADEFPEMNCKSPQAYGGSPVSMMIYVPDVDQFIKRAIDAGAKLARPVENKFYGDRAGSLEDPFGHQWHFATHVEDVPPDEMAKRAEAFMKQQGSA